MYLYASFLLFVIPSIAEDNFFLDDAASESGLLNIESSSDPVPVNGIDSIALNPSSVLDELESSNDGGSAFSPDSFMLDQDPPAIGSSALDDDGTWTAMLTDDHSCSSDSISNSKRVKARDPADVCSVKTSFIPENFRDLDAALQLQIFNNFMCSPSERRIPVGSFPVCSSRIPVNTQFASIVNPKLPQCFLLKDSFLRTYRRMLAHHVHRSDAI